MLNPIKLLLGESANDILAGVKTFKLIDEKFDRTLTYQFEPIRNEFHVYSDTQDFGFHLMSNVTSAIRNTPRYNLIGIEGEYKLTDEDIVDSYDPDYSNLNLDVECENNPSLLDLSDIICDWHTTTGKQVSVTPVQLPNNKFIAVTYNIRGGKLFNKEFNTPEGAYQYSLLRVRYAHYIANVKSLAEYKNMRTELLNITDLTGFNPGDHIYVNLIYYKVEKVTLKTLITTCGHRFSIKKLSDCSVIISNNPVYKIYPLDTLEMYDLKFSNCIKKLENDISEYQQWLQEFNNGNT